MPEPTGGMKIETCNCGYRNVSIPMRSKQLLEREGPLLPGRTVIRPLIDGCATRLAGLIDLDCQAAADAAQLIDSAADGSDLPPLVRKSIRRSLVDQGTLGLRSFVEIQIPGAGAVGQGDDVVA